MSAVDDLIQRRRTRKHGLGLAHEFLARRNMRHMQDRQHLAGAVMRPGQGVLERGQLRRVQRSSDGGGDPLGIEARRELLGGTIDDLGAEALLIAQDRLRRRLEVPDEAGPRQRAQQVIGRIEFPPFETLADARLIGMVIVVPAFTMVKMARSQLLRESSPVT